MNMSITQPSRTRRTTTIAAMLWIALAVTACSEAKSGSLAVAKARAPKEAAIGSTARSAAAATGTIAIKNFAFVPATLSVTAGSKVVWTNRDEEPHLVASADARFHASPALDTDDSYAAVFAKPGVYTYFCSIHPHMVGKIIVK